ncbi:MAG: hypothetical protein KA954_08510 [Chitinophagales bacterium]|nr:hypothetical protein [Bacteroidota bacterium]MBP7399615.1 hypothetical protein [Chitinophagales bacterium]MBK8487988.1 hypothetical protein [Bacteroidota bacterium]MBK8682254.1 hypothetical protein [Bacteroidota bacterium]MBP8753780.1 hypothetical protein [Chitinophagales bacterium]
MKLEFILNVQARFLEKGTNKPLSGKEYICKLFDYDILKNDFLGEAHPDNTGLVHFSVDPKSFRDFNNLIDKYPDLFIEVEYEEELLFATPIAKNAKVLEGGTFDIKEGEVIDLGTFLV